MQIYSQLHIFQQLLVLSFVPSSGVTALPSVYFFPYHDTFICFTESSFTLSIPYHLSVCDHFIPVVQIVPFCKAHSFPEAVPEFIVFEYHQRYFCAAIVFQCFYTGRDEPGCHALVSLCRIHRSMIDVSSSSIMSGDDSSNRFIFFFGKEAGVRISFQETLYPFLRIINAVQSHSGCVLPQRQYRLPVRFSYASDFYVFFHFLLRVNPAASQKLSSYFR